MLSKTQKPLVSIILPVYNTVEYIEESLNALVNQTLEELEIIIINDNSTDGSAEIIEKYSLADDRIKVINNKSSKGPSICRNLGLEEVHGEYITFYDSDDTIELDAYEKLYNFAKKYNQDFVVYDAIRFNDSGTKWPSILHSISITGETYPKTNILEHKELVYDTTSWNKFIKAEFFNKYNFRFAEGRVYQDILFSMQLFCASDCIGVFPETKYNWRVRQNIKKSITQSVSNTKNLKDRVFIIKETIKVINSSPKHKELISSLNKKLVEIDILQFINELDEADDEYKSIMLNEVRNYAKTFSKDLFETLDEIDKVKYDLYFNGSLESLITIVHDCRLKKIEERKYKKLQSQINNQNKELKNIKNLNKNLKKENTNLKNKNDNLKNEMKIVKSTKGWFKYKFKNIYQRLFNKV